MHSILHIAKDCMNRMLKSGSSFFDAEGNFPKQHGKRRFVLTVLICLSVLGLGSCKEQASLQDLSAAKPDLSDMTKGEYLTYAYSVQAALMNAPQTIQNLRHIDVMAALAGPDQERKEGHARQWQFLTNDCALDVYWREGAEGKVIDHYEFRRRQDIVRGEKLSNVKASELHCMQTLVQGRRALVEKNAEETYAVLSLNEQRS